MTDNNAHEHRVLSVQSHVVWGYVGNKSATFPLQLLGFDVDGINSVQFSNHTGYPLVKGSRLDDRQFLELIDGLEANDLLDYSHVLTGYMGSVSALRGVKNAVERVRAVNPDAFYVLDPVMGDDGHMYVPGDVMPVYRDEMLALANVITPNQFEAELLTGITISNEDDALRAIDALHARGVPHVVITSTNVSAAAFNRLTLYGSSLLTTSSTKSASTAEHRTVFRLRLPKLEGCFTGTGDLFAALTLAHSAHRHSAPSTWLRTACERAIATMQVVLQHTLDHAAKELSQSGGLGKMKTNGGGGHNDGETSAKQVRALELRLIQSRDAIEAPRVVLHAETVIDTTVDGVE